MATCEYVFDAKKREQLEELLDYIQRKPDMHNDCTLTLNSEERRVLLIALEYLNDNYDDAIHRHMGSIGLGELGMHFQNASYPAVPHKWQVTRLLRQMTPGGED